MELYFLAGTPTEHIDKSYPVVLYRASLDKKLKTVREVIRRADGLNSIHSWRNVIFALHPHTVPSAVSIIHTDDPLIADNVVFNPSAFDASSNPSGFFVADTRVAVAGPEGPYPDGLFPLSTDFGDPSKGRLAKVSSDRATGRRVSFGGWEEYASLRSDGSAGGPDIGSGILGSAIRNDLGIAISGHTVVIAPLPRDLRATTPSARIWIVASSTDYLVIRRSLSIEELNSATLGDSARIFVLERKSGRWKTTEIEGNTSRSRLAGSWLATIVAKWNPKQIVSPGRDNERGVGTGDLPNVRDLYSQLAGRENLLPGILALQNLADGRKIRIETGQEDSEILNVKDDAILYRVNDTIYQARIDGEQLKDTTVVVKDEDVPEIHWAFWSQ